jgi:hypothetical protein
MAAEDEIKMLHERGFEFLIPEVFVAKPSPVETAVGVLNGVEVVERVFLEASVARYALGFNSIAMGRGS